LDGSRILGRERWMARSVVVKGHIVGSETVQLDEPVPVGATDVEVVVHLPEQSPVRLQELIDFLKSLPPGTRSKEDIDRQIEEDRGSWDR
jgi:hypothetical protein